MSIEFGSFDQPEEEAFKESYKNFKLRQPDFTKGETQTTFICRVIGALPAYNKKKAWFKDDLTNDFKSVNWAFYHPKHCGYKASSPNNPAAIEWKAFVCPRVVKNKVEVVPCAACAKAWNYKEKLKALRDQYKGKEAELEARADYKEMSSYLDSLWTDNKWKVLVMTKDTNEVGILSLSKTTFQTVLYPLMVANAKEPDFWVKFTSQGNNRTKTDKAEILTVEKKVVVEGTEMTVPVRVAAPLSEEDKARIVALAPDISKPIGAYYLTQEKINALVSGSGDPDEVAAIFKDASTEELPEAATDLKSQLA